MTVYELMVWWLYGSACFAFVLGITMVVADQWESLLHDDNNRALYGLLVIVALWWLAVAYAVFKILRRLHIRYRNRRNA
jgi:hypothetical protein